MTRSKALWVPVLALGLAGCAAMNEQECLVSDWRTVGFEDGALGRSPEQIGTYRQACAKHGVRPDLEAYRSGHAEGVESFCQPVKAFSYGRSGGVYRGVCPADLEPGFLAAYGEGRHLHELESAVRSVDARIAQRHRSLDEIKGEITAHEAALVEEGTSAAERVTLLAETKELARRQGVIEAEITELERDRALRAQDLVDYRDTLAYDF